MPERSDIIRRVKALLARAERPEHPEEAASAAAKAQQLLDEYKLSVAELGDGNTSPVGTHQLFLPIAYREWLGVLAVVVSRSSYCDSFVRRLKDGGRAICLGGTETDVAVTHEIFNWIAQQVYQAALRQPRHRDSFAMGAVTTIWQRLGAAAKARQAQPEVNALVVHDRSAILEYMRRLNLDVKECTATPPADAEAFLSGFLAGHEMDLEPKRPLEAPAHKRLRGQAGG